MLRFATKTPSATLPTTSGGTQPPDVSEPGGVSPLVYVGFGAGAAGPVVGAVVGGVSLSTASRLREECASASGCAQEDIDAGTNVAHVATAGFVLGGVGTAVGVVGLLLSGTTDAEPAHASIRPFVELGAVGVSERF